MKELVPLTPSALISRSHDIKKALHRLHSEGFCHGDISGGNIMEISRTLLPFIHPI
ncbi:hypothetical protein F4778DRAFT_729091 [Xylariomycetidae sp. FL2044]|nr:hypothetical protein F4778DRAFT_729091 [Xylariomycetidae sp. FL2044]